MEKDKKHSIQSTALSKHRVDTQKLERSFIVFVSILHGYFCLMSQVLVATCFSCILLIAVSYFPVYQENAMQALGI